MISETIIQKNLPGTEHYIEYIQRNLLKWEGLTECFSYSRKKVAILNWDFFTLDAGIEPDSLGH